jgi:hypothetical protein
MFMEAVMEKNPNLFACRGLDDLKKAIKQKNLDIPVESVWDISASYSTLYFN